MEEYINQIEMFLRGEMSQKEEGMFRKSLAIDAHLRSYVFVIAFMMKAQKTG